MQTPDFTWLFIKMVIGLLFVLGIAVVTLRVILPRTRFGRKGQGGWAHLLDVIRLDQTRSLYLVKIVERYFILGTAEHSLQMIAELSREDGEKALKGEGS